jgi:hypothetical protein
VALNAIVSAGVGEYAGRIAGYKDTSSTSTIDSCYARGDLEATTTGDNGNNDYVTGDTTTDEATTQGASVTADEYHTASWWKDTLTALVSSEDDGWSTITETSPTAPCWSWDAGMQLPKLALGN